MVFAFNGCISVLTALLVYYSVHGYQRRTAKVDNLVPRPSTPPVFDRLQYAKAEGEGLGNFIT